MPGLSGPSPLSVGQFQADASQAGGAQAVGGLSALAGALSGQAQPLAQARYLGAETARAGAQTQQINQQASDLATAQRLLSAPDALTNPANAQQVGALLVKYPEQGKNLAQMIATMRAGVTAAGGQVPGGQAATDQMAASTGVAAMGNTPTGQALDNANRTGVANIGANASIRSAGIGAGATVASANISAAASRANNAATIAGENQRTGVQVLGDDGLPHFMPAVQANATGAKFYDSPLANTVAGAANKGVPVATPDGGTTMATQDQVIKQHLTLAASSPAEVQARIAQTASQPAPVAPNPATAPASPSPNPITPQQNASVLAANVAQASGQPAPSASAAADAAATDAQIVSRLQKLHPVNSITGGSNIPTQGVLDPIRLQMAWLRDNGPQRGDANAAMTQAIANVTGQAGANLDGSRNFMPGSEKSQLILKPGANIIWPPGMPIPPQYQAAAQPAAAPASAPPPPSPLAGTMTQASASAVPGGTNTPSMPGPTPVPSQPPSSLAAGIAQAKAASAPAPQAPAAQQARSPAAVLAEAQDAIARGADPKVVAARLSSMGLALPRPPVPGQ